MDEPRTTTKTCPAATWRCSDRLGLPAHPASAALVAMAVALPVRPGPMRLHPSQPQPTQAAAVLASSGSVPTGRASACPTQHRLSPYPARVVVQHARDHRSIRASEESGLGTPNRLTCSPLHLKMLNVHCVRWSPGTWRVPGSASAGGINAMMELVAFDRPGGGTAIVQAQVPDEERGAARIAREDRKSTRLNSSHVRISYAVFCLKKKT